MSATEMAAGSSLPRRRCRRAYPPHRVRTVSTILLAALVAVLVSACTGAAPSSAPTLPPLALRTAEPAASGATPGPSAVPSPSVSPPGQLRIARQPVADGDEVGVTIGGHYRAWLLSVEGEDPAELVGITRVTDPAGEVRYAADLRAGLLLVDDLHPRVLADEGAVGLYVASTPDEPLAEGEWRVRVATNGTTATVATAVSHDDGNPAPRQLDVVVWATVDVDVEAVAGRWRADMDAVLSPHGLGVDELDVVVAGEAGASHRVLGVDGLAGDGHKACTAADDALGPGPNTAVVVLAERIGEGVLSAAADPPRTWSMAYRNPDGDIGGFAVAAPGTPVVGPPSHACVLVSVGDDPSARGTVALHELLHIAGLPVHTSEDDGRAHDTIEDTPECTSAADGDRDGSVRADECVGLGADNLMFWAEGGHDLTAAQAWRVRWHPLLQTEG